MPEALAIVAVFVVAVVIYIGMWIQSRDPALHNAQEDLIRLRHQVTWLEERHSRAQREQWGEEMVGAIVAERESAARQLAKATTG